MEKHLGRGNKQEGRSQGGNDLLLTTTEIEILQMVTAGYSDTRIADKLGISSHTVEIHLNSIFGKIKTPSRLQAIFWALKNL